MDKSIEAIEKEQKRKRQKEDHEKRKRAIAKAACETFATGSGKVFLRWLMKECGYNSPSSVLNAETGDINFNATVHNEARRGVYLRVRGLLASRPDILAEVENNIKGEIR